VFAEGESEAVRSFLTSIRKLPWQKMQTKIVQTEVCLPTEVDSRRKFKDFQELTCCSKVGGGKHADMSVVQNVFAKVGLQKEFGEIFGLQVPAPHRLAKSQLSSIPIKGDNSDDDSSEASDAGD
jgi:hypothetical protein